MKPFFPGRQALADRSHNAEAHFKRGNALKDKGLVQRAIASYRAALEIKPDFVDAHNNLGLALKQHGRVEDAVACYREALSLKPDFAPALNNLGLSLQELGTYQEAAECFRRALAVAPNAVVLHYNLGNALAQCGQFEEAASCYRKALLLRPDLADAHNNLGRSLQNLGKPEEAIAAYQKALLLAPDNANALANLAGAVRQQGTINATDETIELIIRCFDSTGIDSAEVSTASQRVLIDNLSHDTEAGSAAGIAPLRRPIFDLLIANLKHALITNEGLERLLTGLRRGLLHEVMAGVGEGSALNRRLKLLQALAYQGFMNEYVWDVTDEEIRLVEVLRRKIVDAVDAGDAPVDAEVFLLACYRPIYRVEALRDWYIKAAPELSREWTTPLSELISTPLAEAASAAAVEELTPVDDEVSLAVRFQYEQNPYPRWQDLTVRQPRPYVEQILRDIAPHQPALRKTSDAPEVLIVGCGTGRQPISTALRFSGSRVLAVDLSRASLAYGQRKAAEMGVKNVQFRVADILRLGGLDHRFDVIAASGVLHHMADPRKGLSILHGLLKPGGYLKLGLYSESARRHIVQIRDHIEKQGLTPDLPGIRTVRRFVRESKDFRMVKNFSDFYSSSGVRDLLFNVQEHRFTIPEMQLLIAGFGLEFLGFVITDPAITKGYVERFPDDPDCLNLENWHSFEQQNPFVFDDMFQFWCRKND